MYLYNNNNSKNIVDCNIIIGHNVVMRRYHDVTMNTDVARMLIYYIVLGPIMIFLFS